MSQVKTTAPKQYCVRPNSGRIEVGSEVEVQVLLQAMREDPPPDARCRDKFLVQSVAITPEKDLGTVTAIWQNVEKISKGSIEERKIRVVFLPAEGTASTPQHNNINGTHLGNDAPPAYGSPAPSYGSPAPEAVTPSTRSANAADSLSFNDNQSTTESASNTSAIGAAAASVASSVPTSGDDVRAQLAQAKATIARMTQQSDEQGLRQRKTDAVNQDSRERITTGTTGMGIQQQPADGVPVQIVAALCLLSFLLAYFLF
ncbi:phosphatidylinositol-binding protein scs2 [Imshaugia aleurites]|uniref:Phosphatidylinositol-binding protein scs2 n=1 Tax=Imshaugia aleurites TaxID=172621 RepID=A0A8H3EX40_9LECA|nr:phosphatidylinositol-binding protein scs2 [Imshaugia aleurites]